MDAWERQTETDKGRKTEGKRQRVGGKSSHSRKDRERQKEWGKGNLEQGRLRLRRSKNRYS